VFGQHSFIMLKQGKVISAALMKSSGPAMTLISMISLRCREEWEGRKQKEKSEAEAEGKKDSSWLDRVELFCVYLGDKTILGGQNYAKRHRDLKVFSWLTNLRCESSVSRGLFPKRSVLADDQIRRSSRSVPSNIAKGFERDATQTCS